MSLLQIIFAIPISIIPLTLSYRLLAIKDPFLLPLPPAKQAWNRFIALISPTLLLPLRNRLFLLLRLTIYTIFSPLYLFLWTLDDLLYPAYTTVKIENAVFICGGFRTGSTSLHRGMSLDSDTFVSPRFLELMAPFLTVHYLLDYIERLDVKNNTNIIKAVELRLQDAIGEDVMARHPMSLYDAEEDDVLLAAWQFIGYYTCTLFPHIECWLSSGQIGSMSDSVQTKILKFYERAMQKVLFRRGMRADGSCKSLLSKSHLIGLMPLISKAPNIFITPTFIGTIRNPRDTFVSWFALAQCATLAIAWCSVESGKAVEGHFRFWQKFGDAERDFFVDSKKLERDNDDGADDEDAERDGERESVQPISRITDNRIILKFEDYIKKQDLSILQIYKSLHITPNASYISKLKLDEVRHLNYKEGRGYVNPTLKSLGVSEERMQRELGWYCKVFGV